MGESGSATPDKNGKPTGVRGSDRTLGVSKSIGYGSDSDSQTTTTKSGIITSDKESEYAGKLDNNFDKTKVQNEIDTSVRVTQTFSQNVQEVKAELNSVSDKAKKAKETAQKALADDPTNPVAIEQYNKANTTIQNMQNVGLLVDTISGALYTPADNALGTIANTLSPAIVHEIGQQFKENEELNKLDDGNRDEQGSTRHILAQALVGAVTAGLAGNDALAAGISSGEAEALAPHLAEYLYGTKPEDVSKMTAEQKQTISAIISLGSMAVGATSGSVTDMVASGEAGRVAVEENNLAYAATVVIGGAVVREAIYKAGVSALGSMATVLILANHPIDPDAAIMQAIKDKASGGDKTVSTDNHVTQPQTATFNPKPPDDEEDYLDKPKQKVNTANVGDKVRTPDSNEKDFTRKGQYRVNKYTGEIWSKSYTQHSGGAEWKVGIGKNTAPTSTRKITVDANTGKIIKVNK